MSSMRAIQIDTYGGPEVVTLREVPIPVPGPRQVLIKLHVSGVNFMDIHTRQGKYRTSRTYPQALPTTLGIEGAGVVAQRGHAVHEFDVGDRVAYCLSWGSYAEYAVVDMDRVSAIPPDITFEQAAAVTFQGLTAHYLANEVGQLCAGMTCLVLAASGGIGQMLVRLASLSGARVLAVTSSAAKAETIRRNGAGHVLLYDDGRFAEHTLEVTEGLGVDVVFDPVGKPTFRASLATIKAKGLFVSFGSVGGSINDIDPIELGEAGSISLIRPRLLDYIRSPDVLRQRAAAIYSLVAEGKLSPNIGEIYALDQANVAHEILETRRHLRKPLIALPL